VEDMGSRIPRIYATLDKKKAEYQLHIIEVEASYRNQEESHGVSQVMSCRHEWTEHEG
jgi:hypothetical protein